ncbi:MAG: histidyl-tRNA synthetase [Parcubacteria group bacterium Athens1014_10]|nr:MAG: histidyl-tRNA synthetase [Parcubacteria group bacterium Athens1014_10]TSD06121.1 MAG: histidyl-tRNA synthetase [Parcubacteria group bacterium Athens0714_12]
MPKKTKDKKSKLKKIIRQKAKKSKREVLKIPQLLRGMKDILPEDQKYWDLILDKAIKLAKDNGFKKIETPIIEETSLFKRGVGMETDIVEKEMFSFIDQGGEKVSLRPEATASVARAYIEHGMFNLPQPVKLYYYGPFFRYNRPQSGRQRQFYQFGLEVLGNALPVIDAQIILFSYVFYKEIGLETEININSLGCNTCRERYKKVLLNYLKPKKNFLCSSCQSRYLKNPLRVLDCKEEKCHEVTFKVPQIVDYLCDSCKNHFIKVLEYLDEVEVPYVLNSRLVRGLDYYCRTIFEIFPKSAEEKESSGQLALGGGGRYDYLVKMLGGRETAASGVAFGIERIISKLKEKEIVFEEIKPQIFIAQLGEEARKKCLKIFEDLRKEGVLMSESLSKEGLRGQLEMADKLGVKFTLILGQEEILNETVIIRDMENGVQEVVDLKKIVKEVKKRLGMSNGAA